MLIFVALTACAKDAPQKEIAQEPKLLANMPNPSAQVGARVFQTRCELCHGSKGMGEGALALTLKGYPDTNLLQPKYKTDVDSLRKQIIFGGSQGQMHRLLPPWGDELTWTEIESVVKFVRTLRENPETAFEMLSKEVKNQKPTLGRLTFKNRCALCHDPDGEGNGKMARIIEDPPPFNLTYSILMNLLLIVNLEKGYGHGETV